MAILQVSVPVSKEAYELAAAVYKLISEVKKHVADGVAADDIPALIELLLSKEIVEGVKGIDQLDDEIKENPEAFVNAFATIGSALLKDIVQK